MWKWRFKSSRPDFSRAKALNRRHRARPAFATPGLSPVPPFDAAEGYPKHTTCEVRTQAGLEDRAATDASRAPWVHGL